MLSRCSMSFNRKKRERMKILNVEGNKKRGKLGKIFMIKGKKETVRKKEKKLNKVQMY